MKHLGIIATAALLLLTFEAMAQTDNDTPPDWITATNKPCKIWNPNPEPHESVTWSGQCKDGFASGKGVLKWTENGMPDAEFDGEYANGKRNGPGVLILPNGERMEGQWVNDEAVGEDGNSI